MSLNVILELKDSEELVTEHVEDEKLFHANDHVIVFMKYEESSKIADATGQVPPPKKVTRIYPMSNVKRVVIVQEGQ